MSASLRGPMNVLVMASLLTLLLFVGAAAQGAEEALPRDIIAKEFIYSLTGAYVGGLFGYVLSIYLYNHLALDQDFN
ncbi:hypothetical protein HYR54_03055 [Candidatus Acetothermia bacterium]|nr:hypothetical protein [Candidatus Acetothermia bacterium]